MKIDKYIEEDKFDELYDILINKYNLREIDNILSEYAFRTKNIGAYLFVAYILSQNENSEIHEIAYLMLCNPFCHLPGAYFAALYHARKCVELSDDQEYMEYLLFLNEVPDKVVSDEEADEIRNLLSK